MGRLFMVSQSILIVSVLSVNVHAPEKLKVVEPELSMIMKYSFPGVVNSHASKLNVDGPALTGVPDVYQIARIIPIE